MPGSTITISAPVSIRQRSTATKMIGRTLCQAEQAFDEVPSEPVELRLQPKEP